MAHLWLSLPQDCVSFICLRVPLVAIGHLRRTCVQLRRLLAPTNNFWRTYYYFYLSSCKMMLATDESYYEVIRRCHPLDLKNVDMANCIVQYNLDLLLAQVLEDGTCVANNGAAITNLDINEYKAQRVNFFRRVICSIVRFDSTQIVPVLITYFITQQDWWRFSSIICVYVENSIDMLHIPLLEQLIGVLKTYLAGLELDLAATAQLRTVCTTAIVRLTARIKLQQNIVSYQLPHHTLVVCSQGAPPTGVRSDSVDSILRNDVDNLYYYTLLADYWGFKELRSTLILVIKTASLASALPALYHAYQLLSTLRPDYDNDKLLSKFMAIWRLDDEQRLRACRGILQIQPELTEACSAVFIILLTRLKNMNRSYLGTLLSIAQEHSCEKLSRWLYVTQHLYCLDFAKLRQLELVEQCYSAINNYPTGEGWHLIKESRCMVPLILVPCGNQFRMVKFTETLPVGMLGYILADNITE